MSLLQDFRLDFETLGCRVNTYIFLEKYEDIPSKNLGSCSSSHDLSKSLQPDVDTLNGLSSVSRRTYLKCFYQAILLLFLLLQKAWLPELLRQKPLISHSLFRELQADWHVSKAQTHSPCIDAEDSMNPNKIQKSMITFSSENDHSPSDLPAFCPRPLAPPLALCRPEARMSVAGARSFSQDFHGVCANPVLPLPGRIQMLCRFCVVVHLLRWA